MPRIHAMLRKVRSLILARREALQSVALLLVRLSVGVVFAMTGWGKLHHLPDIIEFFRSLGIPAPELQAPFVSGLEFAGGLLLVVGLGARLISLPLMGTMVVAMVTAKAAEVEALTDVLGFIEWHYLVFFAVIVLLGPGQLSLDHVLGKKLLAPRAPAPQAVLA